ncbi:MAG: S41 family peptidase [Alphaproteobacteria bacterium]
MSTEGYYRYPAVFNDTVVFASEDDLWSVPLKGGVARRLTSGLGRASHPVFSPDGQWVAFSATEEGHMEVFVMPSKGGPAKRLTFLGDTAQVVDWTDEGIFFIAPKGYPLRVNYAFKISPEGGRPQEVKIGPATHISFGSKKGSTVIQRHGYREFGYWKRYRGGTAGQMWIDTLGKGNFHEIADKDGNISRPLWIGDRIYYASDHDNHGNLYSCTPDGKDIQQHTKHTGFYVRNQTTDGNTIVYHVGGDIFAYDIKSGKDTKLKVDYSSPRTQRNRKFVAAAEYLDDYDIHPKGHHLSTINRGQAFVFGNWDGPVMRFGESSDARYRLSRWLNDGKRVLVVSDEQGEEGFEIYDAESLERKNRMPKKDIGRVLDIKISPTADDAIFTNHRCEIFHINLKSWKLKQIDRSPHSTVAGFDWSPDGKWVVYNCSNTPHTSMIKLAEVKTGKSHQITRSVLRDTDPSFCPEGKYIYFLSHRQFNPAWDTLHFELCFPRGTKPYLITLQKDLPSPFSTKQDPLEEKEEKDTGSKKKSAKPKPIKIDLDGIQERIIAFPLEDGIYSDVVGLNGKVLYTTEPLESCMGGCPGNSIPARTTLHEYDFETQTSKTVYDGITDFTMTRDRSMTLYQVGSSLRVYSTGSKPDTSQEHSRFSKTNGWIKLSRITVSVDPVSEWRQMLDEAWRLQRDHFWTEKIPDVDWNKVLKRYQPMVERINTREEFSDLLWEMQGELGTSHAYVMGGDLKDSPHYGVGQLAADYSFDKKKKAYRIDRIIRGDPWDERKSSPLIRSGINVKENDYIWAVNDQPVTETTPPEALLVNMSGEEVRLTVSNGKSNKKRRVQVKTLDSIAPGTYREWVDQNREYVHKKTKGKVGYIHIPDMSVWGYSEFHRGFLAEIDREGLIVDARFNGGGNVSPLLLEKLARRRLGFDMTRWFGVETYPSDSPAGPMVALTNEYAGSDGDIFSHGFKMLNLGPLIGKRTWGGVIGIWPRHSLKDGGYTTQPEFSFWFNDIGWSVENYGVDPDIEVDITPQDYAKGQDPQLDRGIKEVESIIRKNPPMKGPEPPKHMR